ncbi:hypothetical protein D3C72_1536910 [compost metagenome]
MKKFFLAFSILFSFSFAWADIRPANPGNDPLEGMTQDGAGTNAVGVKGVCSNCLKNSWNGPRDASTNPAPAGTAPTNNNPATGGANTQ